MPAHRLPVPAFPPGWLTGLPARKSYKGQTMFIQTEETPNPATIKFLPGREVLAGATLQFASADEAAASPLARRLFAIEGVEAVFFGEDFVSVSKAGDARWIMIKPQVLGAIMEHFTSGEPLLEGAAANQTHESVGFDEEDAEIVDSIRELLDTRVRPAVAQDGGDILFHGFSKGVVYLTLRGACSGCPSSTATLRGGIENMLKHYVPEVMEVRAVA